MAAVRFSAAVLSGPVELFPMERMQLCCLEWLGHGHYGVPSTSNLSDTNDSSGLSGLSHLSHLSDLSDLSDLSHLSGLSHLSHMSHLSANGLE